MEREQIGASAPRRDDSSRSAAGAEPSLGELFTRLSADTGDLIRQQVALARSEIRQTGTTLARDSTKIGVALSLALAGMMALTAFLVVALGNLFDNYWAAALVVGAVLLAIGGILARNAVNDVKRRGLAPEQTMDTLRTDATWAKEEAGAVKRELTR